MRRKLATFLWLLIVWSAPAFSQTVRYSVAMPQPASHVFRVEITIDRPGMATVDLDLPAWNGLYQIRDFSQFVENLQANVAFKRIDKDTWRFTAGNNEQIRISYGVFANEWSSFSSQLDES